MNIFVLDELPQLAARYHCDKHVIKMILESAQILCTSLVMNGVDPIDVPYKPTHSNHPCVVWARSDLANWKWLYNLIFELDKEYRFRYEKTLNHGAYAKIKAYNLFARASYEWNNLFEKNKGSMFVQCMPEKYKIEGDPVKAYRNYYIEEKYEFATWKKDRTPHWWQEKNFNKITEERIRNVLDC